MVFRPKNTSYPTILLLWSRTDTCSNAGKTLTWWLLLFMRITVTDIYQIILTNPDLKIFPVCGCFALPSKLCLFHERLNRIIICNSFWKAQNNSQCLRWGVKLKGHKKSFWEYLVLFLAPHRSWFHAGWGDAKNVTGTIAEKWLVRGDQLLCIIAGWRKRDKIWWRTNQINGFV